jgi:hypothetical protein
MAWRPPNAVMIADKFTEMVTFSIYHQTVIKLSQKFTSWLFIAKINEYL